jgi:hypothetical protein
MKEGEFGTYPEIISWKEDEVKALGRRLTPLVLVKKKADCLDLPAKVFDTIKCEGNEEALRVANAIARTSATGIEALEKLREFSDGFQYTRINRNNQDTESNTNGDKQNTIPTRNMANTVNWVGSPKLGIIKQLLDFYHTDNGGCGRLVIYACFHATIDKLVEFVQSCGYTCGRIDGRGWSTPNILETFDKEVFLSEHSQQFKNYCIIANPACVHGLSFTRTQCLVYYSNNFSVDARIQSMDRRDRPGMDKEVATRIVDIVNLPTDQMILDKLNSSMEIQEITLKEIIGCIIV